MRLSSHFQYPICGLLLLITSVGFSQTSIGGVINSYHVALTYDSCQAALTLENTDGLEASTEILIIQMQGATINESNTANFGTITDIGSAGLYEIATIASINDNTLFLNTILLNEYDFSENVQVVSLPSYESATVDNPLSAQAWDGMTGGILALKVEGTLALNAPIQVNGLGFRGGDATIFETNDCSWFNNEDNYFYNASNWRGALKGEGIAAFTFNREAGRGAQANGGGGGNDHNSGGGGGGNVVAGGQGGINDEPAFFGCDGDFPGIGGKPINTSEDRWFLGGGGGAGHDNNDAGTNGGNGGGIIVLIANTVVGNDFVISANGNDAITTNGDGAGGGGGGGTIIWAVDEVVGGLSLEAKGGNGGNANNTNNDRCFGPGGGGSGGRVLTQNTTAVTLLLNRGQAGESINSSDGGCSGTNGATNGNNGISEVFDDFIQGTDSSSPPTIIEQPEVVSICPDAAVLLEVETEGANLDFQWQINNGSGFMDLTESPPYSGTTTSTLAISSVSETLAMNASFRLLITSTCFDPLFSEIISFDLTPLPDPSFEVLLNGNQIQLINNSGFSDTFSWDFGDANGSMEIEPTHTYLEDGIYTITLTATNICGTLSTTEIVVIETSPNADFSAMPEEGCAPFAVQFMSEASANADSLSWFFPGGNPATASTIDPIVTYESAGTFSVSLIAINGAGADTLVVNDLVLVNDAPIVDFTSITNQLTVDFTNLSSGADTYLWSFGDGATSTLENPSHTYMEEGVYDILLTAFNNCGQVSFQQTIAIGPPPEASFAIKNPIGCAPVEIFFVDQSSGSIESWDWSFPGGTPATSTEQNPVVIYTEAGNYDVTLIVTGPTGESQALQQMAVIVGAFPTPDFTFEVDGPVVSFTNLTEGASAYSWNFGDGNSSNEVNPVHVYEASGIYTVTLNAQSSFCGNSLDQELEIVVSSTALTVLEEVHLFPNPTASVLWLDNMDRVESIQLLNVQGQQLIWQESRQSQEQLDLTHLPSGLYLLVLHSKVGKRLFKVKKN